jgi:UDP-N-acetylglucosamine acyltransferase
VRIGAYAVVGPEVALEDDVEVGHHAVLEGLVEVGAGARLGHGAVVGGEPQDLKYRPGTVSGVRIGPRAVVREYVTIHRGSREGAFTELGPECLVMAYAHVAHDCRIGRNAIVINYAGLTGHCQIGDHATVGGLTGLAPFVRIGAYAYVGGCSKVTADVLPGMLANGSPATIRAVNAVGLRRSGIDGAERRILRDVYRLLYRSGLTPERALARVREEVDRTPVVAMLLEFAAGARKGLCGPPGGWGRPGGAADAAPEDELA